MLILIPIPGLLESITNLIFSDCAGLLKFLVDSLTSGYFLD